MSLRHRMKSTAVKTKSAMAGVYGLAFWLLLSGITVAAFASAPQAAKLGIKPVGEQGTFFQLSLSPGASQRQAVELTNYGGRSIAARTFPADAYTIVNGGFGARLRAEPKSGTTLWTDYKEEKLQLSPRRTITRDFLVSVPTGTLPGDYITSLVIENEEPIKGEAGAVAINQVQRQAIAVAISVPGPRTPKLEFAGAKHSFVGEKSVVAVALQNSGNAQLKPTGRLTIKDRSNKSVFSGPTAMDSFYAKTSTSLEVPLHNALQPGRYTAKLELEDRGLDLKANSRPLPFQVTGEPQVDPREDPGGEGASGTSGPPLWLIFGAGPLAVLGLLGGILLGRRQGSKPKTA